MRLGTDNEFFVSSSDLFSDLFCNSPSFQGFSPAAFGDLGDLDDLGLLV
jgi:hypothetical protein